MVSGDSLDPAGLYRTLKRMESAGLVSSFWDTESCAKPRRVYSVTEQGLDCLRNWRKTLLEYRNSLDTILTGIEHCGVVQASASQPQKDTDAS